MRRLTAAAVVACVVAVLGAAAPADAVLAVAQPSPTEPPADEEPGEIEVPEPVPGEEQCQLADPRLVQLSGLVAVDDGYIVINDSVQLGLDDRLPIFFLNQACEVVDEQAFLPGRPFDPEDLELDRENNVLWVGDTGDNAAAGTGEGEPRATVALWRVDLGGGDRTPVIHRFVFEDGQPRDAEALVLDSDGVPIIVTKSVGTAELFKPTDLIPDNPPEQAVPLAKVGEFSPPDTGSDHDLLPSAAARQTVTGGANSPSGEAVVLRTYTDALEFDVVEGDVVAAITQGQPRVTPLPGEPWGESISYSPDGERFLTVSEVPDEQIEFVPVILEYTPTPPAAPEPPPEEVVEDSGGGGFSLVNDVQDIINLIAAVGLIGLLLVAAGVYGILRARRRSADAAEDDDLDEEDADRPVTGRARLAAEAPLREPDPSPEPAGGVYGSAAARGTQYGAGGYPAGGYEEEGYPGQSPPRGGQYGGGEYGAPARGNEYGGGPARGTEYGGGPARSNEYGGAPARGGEYGGGEYGGAPPRGREYGGGAYQGGQSAGGQPPAGGYNGADYHGADQHDGDYHGGERRGGSYQRGDYRGDSYQGGDYRGGGYQEGDYRGDAYQGGDYGQAGYPPATSGGGYGGADPGYRDAGYRDAGYRDAGYRDAGYGQAAHPEPAYESGWTDDGAGYSQPDPGGAYQPSAPDYYSDDPDYPYEFRDPNRW